MKTRFNTLSAASSPSFPGSMATCNLQRSTHVLKKSSGDESLFLVAHGAGPAASPSPGGEGWGEGGLFNHKSKPVAAFPLSQRERDGVRENRPDENSTPLHQEGRSEGGLFNRKSQIVNRKSEQGIALVITLILLSVT